MLRYLRNDTRGPEVLAFGDINVDIVVHLARYPAKGEDALADSSEIHFGGSAANTAVALSRMGIGTGLIARVGCDSWAGPVEQFLISGGVDLAGLQRDPTVMTGLMYIIVTPDGERTILGYRGANTYTDPSLIDDAPFRSARLFHLSGYSLITEPQRSALCSLLRSLPATVWRRFWTRGLPSRPPRWTRCEPSCPGSTSYCPISLRHSG